MPLIKFRKLTPGVYLLDIKSADVRILCACPADIIKFIIRDRLACGEIIDNLSTMMPNVFLLSDKLMQNGSISNLTEFPLMHIFYMQGTQIPGHPNYGKRPIMIGKKELLEAQLKYLSVGNFGITNQKEMAKYCPSAQFANDLIDMKRRFAKGKFKRYTSLLNVKPYDDNRKLELRNGVSIKRMAENVFEITYKQESVTVDLNLKKGESYGMTYVLPKAVIPKGRFTVTNTGLGDGWDPNRSCFSSLLRYNTKNYLIDGGPNVGKILRSLDMAPENIDGIFQTHIHDDHFAGYDCFWNSRKKTTVYSVLPVIRSMQKKMMSLFNVGIKEINRKFNFIGMDYDKWFALNGLEIIPFNSPHPVETSIFMFRNNDGKSQKTYAHYGDLVSFETLDKLFQHDSDAKKKRAYYKLLKSRYMMQADIKKIDVGGGLIHGQAEDFKNDKSNIKIFGHIARNLSNVELQLGLSEPYGHTRVLIG